VDAHALLFLTMAQATICEDATDYSPEIIGQHTAHYVAAPDGGVEGDCGRQDLKIRLTNHGIYCGCVNQSRLLLLQQVLTLGARSIPIGLRDDDNDDDNNDMLKTFIEDMANTQALENDNPRFLNFYVIAMMANIVFQETLPTFGRDYSFFMALIVVLPLDTIVYKLFQQERLRETEAKLQEWRPFFEAKGFMTVLRHDEQQWWFSSDLYVHIIQRPTVRVAQGTTTHHHTVLSPRHAQGQQQQLTATTTQSTTPRNITIPYPEEVKYLILYSRMFLRRNQHMRDILEWESNMVKPPQLAAFNDILFQHFMCETRWAARMAKTNRRVLHVVYWLSIVVVAILIHTFCKTTLDWAILSLPLVASVWLVVCLDQCLLLHVLPTRFPDLIEQDWKPRLERSGFTVSYHVDKPHWWSWKETYMHIRRLGHDRPRPKNADVGIV